MYGKYVKVKTIYKNINNIYIYTHTHTYIHIYRMSQEECARLREGVPYV